MEIHNHDEIHIVTFKQQKKILLSMSVSTTQLNHINQKINNYLIEYLAQIKNQK